MHVCAHKYNWSKFALHVMRQVEDLGTTKYQLKNLENLAAKTDLQKNTDTLK